MERGKIVSVTNCESQGGFRENRYTSEWGSLHVYKLISLHAVMFNKIFHEAQKDTGQTFSRS